jgi:hypothetical protein
VDANFFDKAADVSQPTSNVFDVDILSFRLGSGESFSPPELET